MDRRAFLEGIGLGVFAAPLATTAQQTERRYRIGVLGDAPPTPADQLTRALGELGYEPGRVLIAQRWSEGKAARRFDLADELLRLNPHVVVALGRLPGSVLATLTKTTPIIVVGADLIEGFVPIESLARPKTNVTGISIDAGDVRSKRLELLKALAPRARLIGMIADADASWDSRFDATRSLGIELRFAQATEAELYDAVFRDFATQKIDAVILDAAFAFMPERGRVVRLAARYRLPTIYPSREYAELGGLMAYGATLVEMYRKAALYVDKILKGAKPRDLPIEQPTKFELVINAKTAKALGLTIPPSVLVRADHIIE